MSVTASSPFLRFFCNLFWHLPLCFVSCLFGFFFISVWLPIFFSEQVHICLRGKLHAAGSGCWIFSRCIRPIGGHGFFSRVIVSITRSQFPFKMLSYIFKDIWHVLDTCRYTFMCSVGTGKLRKKINIFCVIIDFFSILLIFGIVETTHSARIYIINKFFKMFCIKQGKRTKKLWNIYNFSQHFENLKHIYWNKFHFVLLIKFQYLLFKKNWSNFLKQASVNELIYSNYWWSKSFWTQTY